MAKLSISRAWDETREVVGRDGKLIATVAAAFIVLPGTIAGLFQPQAQPGQLPGFGTGGALMLVSMVIGMIGQLAIIRLAAGPSLSVSEAIRHGLQRVLPLLAAIILFVAPVMIIAVGLARAVGTDPQNGNTVAALLLLLLVPVIIFLLIRLILMAPVASAERAGPIAIIRRSWVLTSGNWWRLFGFFLVWMVAVIVVFIAVGSVAGTLARVIFGEVERITVGALLVELTLQLIMAGLTVLVAVMLARIYAQLAGGSGAAEVTVPASGD